MTTTRPVRRLLVANRGEIAQRVFRTARAMGMTTVAVHSDPDATAPFVRSADFAVRLPGATSAETYLNAERVIEAALRAGADAIHPGYGFLSENAGFAEAVMAAGLVWVGPPPEAIKAMGDKLTALHRMREAGVPTLPRADVTGLGDADLVSAAEAVGYPLLVKASAGGGGKGMRVVASPDRLVDEVAGARREAAKAFGSDVVFLERYVSPARHIEVQIMADQHGQVRHLFERECSVQRRHQKVVEESPSPFLDDATRERICAAAVAAAQSVGYVGAGTVEFVVASTGEFFFLEMNTRLQVEHPVTECVTGTDLVRLQLLVAQGEPLPPAPFVSQGASIEARVYAEDPAAGFLPASGRLIGWREPTGVRVDSGVAEGDEVSIHYDPMLAKVIAHAPTRREAAEILARALSDLRAHGPATNRDFLVRVLRHPAFLAGDTTTDFIDRHTADLVPVQTDDAMRRAAVVAAISARQRRLATDPGRLPVPAGWRNSPSQGDRTSYEVADHTMSVELTEDRHGSLVGSIDDTAFSARLLAAEDPWFDVECDGLRARATVITDGATLWVQDADGEVRLSEQPRFPEPVADAIAGALTAPMNGTVVAINVQPGEHVVAGQTLAILEAMKMEHRITAPAEGVVTDIHVIPGRSVTADQLMLVVDADATD